jgi:hypothetical protein
MNEEITKESLSRWSIYVEASYYLILDGSTTGHISHAVLENVCRMEEVPFSRS